MEDPEVSKIVVAGKQCVLLRTPEYSVLISSALVGAIFFSRGHLAMSGDNFGCYNLENANGMQQQIKPKDAAQHPKIDRKPPQQRILQPKVLVVAKVRRPQFQHSGR